MTMREQLWESVGQLLGLGCDAPMQLSRKYPNLTIAIGVEPDPHIQYRTVATMTWQPLGIDLDVAPRAFRDILSHEIKLAGLEKFRVCGHEADQVRALLNLPVSLRLSAALFHEVRLHDCGARITSTKAGDTEQELRAFVNGVLGLADALDVAIQQIPARLVMRPYAQVWLDHAQRLHGRFEPGRVRIHDGRVGADRLEIATLWKHDKEVSGTRIRLTLLPPLATEPSSLAVSLARQLEADCTKVTVAAEAIELELAAAVINPIGLGPLVERAARFVAALRGPGESGPYR